MFPNEYRKLQARTESQDQNRTEKMTNFVLGLAGESAELFKVVRWGDENAEIEILKESGDVFWYASGFSSCMGLEFQEVFEMVNADSLAVMSRYHGYDLEDWSKDLIENVGDMVDLVKKIVFHGHPENNQITAKLTYSLGRVVFCVKNIGREIGLKPEDIMSANIEKLRKRFPSGFTTADSIARVDTK